MTFSHSKYFLTIVSSLSIFFSFLSFGVSAQILPETTPPKSYLEVEDKNKDQWSFQIQPYGTLPITTYGNVIIGGRTVEYQQSLGDLLQVLRMVVSGRIEAWYNNFGFITDDYYVSLQGSGIKNTGPILDTSFQSVLTFDQGIYDFALSYHIGPKQDLTSQNFPLLSFEPIVGVRLNSLSSTINSTLNVGIVNTSFQKSVSIGRTWFEPMLGGKLALQISKPIILWARGDVSGFGLAGQDDLSWNTLAGVDWWVNQNTFLTLGYHFYQISYTNNNMTFNESLNGLYIAATFKF